MTKRKTVNIDVVREAVANYMCSEGCSCCENMEDHEKHTKVLAELLNVPMYDDESGYDFYQFATRYKNDQRKSMEDVA